MHFVCDIIRLVVKQILSKSFKARSNPSFQSKQQWCCWHDQCGWLTVFQKRRIFTFLGFFIGGGLYFFLIVIGCSVIWALTIITVGMTLLAFQAVAVKTNPNDLAPEYAGLLNGLANTAANNAGWVSRNAEYVTCSINCTFYREIPIFRTYLGLWRHSWRDSYLIRIVS